jgi:hypothetical protein
MTSPIKMCENGHNVCSSCKEQLTQCPYCTGKYSNFRNIPLEIVAATAVHLCNNQEAGCEGTFTLDDKDKHLAMCWFQSTDCPFRKLSGVDCPWSGILSDILVHTLAEHDSETVEVPTHFRVELINFVVRSRYRRVVICLGELFYLTWERNRDILNFGVFHFGPKNETNNFKYGIKIGNSEFCVSVTRNCHNYLDGGFTEMQHRDYVTLSYKTVLYCLNAIGYLSCEIEIGKEKLDGFVSDELREFLQDAFAIGSDSVTVREMLGNPPPQRQSLRPTPPSTDHHHSHHNFPPYSYLIQGHPLSFRSAQRSISHKDDLF